MNTMSDAERLAGLLDRHGADFAAWPDQESAQWARRTVMADAAARAEWETAKRLDAMLDAHAMDLAARAARDGVADRVAAGVMAALPRRPSELRVWLPRMAAGFLVAAVLGGAFDHFLWQDAMAEDVLSVETMVFGPGEGEFE